MLFDTVFIIWYFYSIYALMYKRSQMRKYTKITIGMSEAEMLKIMGEGYDMSSLRNNRIKYEWRIGSTRSSYQGTSTYSGVSKVDIYTRNGIVEEIRPYNVR